MYDDDMEQALHNIANRLEYMNEVLKDSFISTGETDSHGEAYPNVTDGLFEIARAIHRVACAMYGQEDPQPKEHRP